MRVNEKLPTDVNMKKGNSGVAANLVKSKFSSTDYWRFGT